MGATRQEINYRAGIHQRRIDVPPMVQFSKTTCKVARSAETHIKKTTELLLQIIQQLFAAQFIVFFQLDLCYL